jgi:salicylate hydroxylase
MGCSTTDRPAGPVVAVVGGGIAGLTVAIMLARAGIDCTVHEQTDHSGQAGAGIQLSPNGTRLLRHAGLAAPLAAVSVRPAAIELRRWRDGTILHRTELGATGELRYGAPYYTLHRAALHRLLATRVGTVRGEHRCVGVTEHPDGVELRFSDGSTSRADLVVGADGLHSVVRASLVADRPRVCGLTVHRGLVSASALRGSVLSRDPSVRIWLGPGGHVVSYPVSAGAWNLVAVLPTGTELSDAYGGWDPLVHNLLGATGRLTGAPLYERPVAPRWCTRRIVLVGDAAHALLPFGAQGANQAIEDAAALAVCLRGVAAAAVPDALLRYERLRVPRLARVAAMVDANRDSHHLADGPRQRRRDDAARVERAGSDAHAWLFGYDAELAGSQP